MGQNVYHGKNIDDAIKTACDDLKVDRSAINVNVVDPGKRGFLGFGKKPAVIEVTFLKDLIATIDDSEDELVKLPFSKKDQKAILVIKQMIEDLFAEAGIVGTISWKIEDDQIIFKIESEDYKGLIIGKKGKTINSLQSLAQTIFSHQAENRYFIVFDIDNYRELRGQQITDWLDQAVNSVRDSGRTYRFSPMIAVERRLIIKQLKCIDDITFRIRGSYPRKYIEIYPRRLTISD